MTFTNSQKGALATIYRDDGSSPRPYLNFITLKGPQQTASNVVIAMLGMRADQARQIYGVDIGGQDGSPSKFFSHSALRFAAFALKTVWENKLANETDMSIENQLKLERSLILLEQRFPGLDQYVPAKPKHTSPQNYGDRHASVF